MGFPPVSGKNKAQIPDNTPVIAKIRFGTKPGKRIMNGAETPPRRPNIDPNPTPIVRISVEKSSAAKTYTAQNDPEIANCYEFKYYAQAEFRRTPTYGNAYAKA